MKKWKTRTTNWKQRKEMNLIVKLRYKRVWNGVIWSCCLRLNSINLLPRRWCGHRGKLEGEARGCLDHVTAVVSPTSQLLPEHGIPTPQPNKQTQRISGVGRMKKMPSAHRRIELMIHARLTQTIKITHRLKDCYEAAKCGTELRILGVTSTYFHRTNDCHWYWWIGCESPCMGWQERLMIRLPSFSISPAPNSVGAFW
jgi:hypothetical protein